MDLPDDPFDPSTWFPASFGGLVATADAGVVRVWDGETWEYKGTL